MAIKTNNLSTPDAQKLSQQIKTLTETANKNKGVKAADLRALKDEVDKSGYGAQQAGNQGTVSSVLDEMAKMAAAQEAGKPIKGSDQAWAEDMKALQQLTDATAVVNEYKDGQATANDVKVGGEQVAAAAGIGSKDEVNVPQLYADANSKDASKNNITKLADDKYVATLNDPNASTEAIGQAQRAAMIAFQVQYPKASLSEFQDHMKYTIGTSTADENRKTSVTAAVGQASFSDMAANPLKTIADAAPANPRANHVNGY